MQDSDKFTYSKSIRIIVKLSCRIFDILHRTEQDRVWSKLRRWLMCMREKLAGRCWSKCQVQRKLWQSWSLGSCSGHKWLVDGFYDPFSRPGPGRNNQRVPGFDHEMRLRLSGINNSTTIYTWLCILDLIVVRLILPSSIGCKNYFSYRVDNEGQQNPKSEVKLERGKCIRNSLIDSNLSVKHVKNVRKYLLFQ